MELFNLDVLKDSLIDQSVAHIKKKVYMKTSWAYTVDMFHGLNLIGIYNARKIEATLSGCGIIWSSSIVKDVHRDIEKEM
jgi:hypothetical protein